MEYTILLLDDDEEMLELTKCNLETVPYYKIHPFGDPVQALRRVYLYGVPDLIVTDLELPKMDGIEFIARVAHDYPAVRAVIFTGRTEALQRNCKYPVILKEPDAFEHLIRMIELILHPPVRE